MFCAKWLAGGLRFVWPKVEHGAQPPAQGRAEYQKALRKDMATLSAHNERRAEYMVRRANELQGVPASAADRRGIVKVSLREQQHELRLLPPAEDFWPFEDYVKKHGDPNKFKKRGPGSCGLSRGATAAVLGSLLPIQATLPSITHNRAAEPVGKCSCSVGLLSWWGGGCPPGHVVKKVNGVKGVVVPGTESGGPWKLQRGFASCVVHEQEHDCDSDADPAVVQRKFAMLRPRQQLLA